LTGDHRFTNPLDVRDWDRRVAELPGATVFHSARWARVLADSYGFTPVYFVSQAGGGISHLVPLMEVSSPLTGKRGVSLPFSDTCTILVPDEEIGNVRAEILRHGTESGWRSVEFRDDLFFKNGSPPSMRCLLHTMSLTPNVESTFASLRHPTKNSVKKASKVGVSVLRSRSSEGMEVFYRLHCRTRKRHGLPPQPIGFFRKVHDYLVSKNMGCVFEAAYRGRVVASAVCLHFGKQAIVKYSAFDDSFQNVRPNNLLVWKIIVWAGRSGFEQLSFGRSELGHEGLLRFKRGWNLDESPIAYYKYSFRRKTLVPDEHRVINLATKVFPHVPLPVLKFIGRLSYRHIS
jgi:CelD/BcsL family acetyltransferase involved in cellulose biosynthesis